MGLTDRLFGMFGLGRRECTGDGSHRVCEAGKHCHLVRDCSGATELAGTQLIPGFRFAAAEQIRLYGNNPALPTGMAHWPVTESEQPKAETPKDDKPKMDKPMDDKPKEEKPKEEKPKEEKPRDDKKGNPTGLSIYRPFTHQ
jgi:outer membrane biosynthesis protein TonB